MWSRSALTCIEVVTNENAGDSRFRTDVLGCSMVEVNKLCQLLMQRSERNI